MNKLQQAIIQAIVITAVGCVVAFAHNAFSVNGINPFRQIKSVPVINDDERNEAEGIRIIGIGRAREIVDAGRMVIDARTAEEYAGGHLPGAVLLDYYEMGHYLAEVLPLLSPGEQIMIYCESITCEDSELLARELYTMGFTNLVVFKGGYEEWEGAGLPIEQ